MIVLVDDLDRCTKSEIRTVLSGLSTYLGNDKANKDEAPVSFVVALDSERAESAFELSEGATTGRASSRYNYLGKHCHVFVPVPHPSFKQLEKIVEGAALELDWKLSSGDQQQMARLAAKWAASNLRATRAAVNDAFLIHLEAAAALQETPDENIRQFHQSPTLLMRVALIRSASRDSALREFLVNPAYWFGRNAGEPKGFALELLNEEQRFRPGKLDPRPLLQVGIPSTSIYDPGNLSELSTRLKDSNPAAFNAELSTPMEAVARLSIASYMLSAFPLSGLPENDRGRVATRIVRLLEKGKDLLGPDSAYLFDEAFSTLGTGNTWNHVEQNEWDFWVEVASRSGDASFAKFTAKNSPMMRPEKLAWTRQSIGRFLPQLPASQLSLLLAEERQRATNGPEAQAIANQYSAISLRSDVNSVQGFGAFCVHILQKWDYSQAAPPDYLFGEAAQRAIESEGLEREAGKVPTLLGADRFGMGAKLGSAGWSRYVDQFRKKDS